MPLDVLHIAALPFPTPQGTQAVIHQIVASEARRGLHTMLWCYGHADGRVLESWKPSYPIKRSVRLSSDQRSGPSVIKIVQDIFFVFALCRWLSVQRPKKVVAHHIEAASMVYLCNLLIGDLAWTYAAHTSLALELPTYFSHPKWSQWARRLGFRMDRFVYKAAPHTSAISPWLRRYARRLGAAHVQRLHVPWVWNDAIHGSPEHSDELKLLYIGNTDRYQGLETLRDVVRTLSKDFSLSLCIANTEPSITPFDHDPEIVHHRVDRLDASSLDRIYQRASVLVVPRTLKGGVPVKLLEALRSPLPVLFSSSLIGCLEGNLHQSSGELGLWLFEPSFDGLSQALRRIATHRPHLSPEQINARQDYLRHFYGDKAKGVAT